MFKNNIKKNLQIPYVDLPNLGFMHVTIGLSQMEKVAGDAIQSIASCRTCRMQVKSKKRGLKVKRKR